MKGDFTRDETPFSDEENGACCWAVRKQEIGRPKN